MKLTGHPACAPYYCTTGRSVPPRGSRLSQFRRFKRGPSKQGIYDRRNRAERQVRAAEMLSRMSQMGQTNSDIGQLFDHLVGERKKSIRYIEAERFGGLKIQYEFEFGGLDHRKVGRPLALENPS